MAEPRDLLRRDRLYDDAIALAADADRAEATANVLDRMPDGCGRDRRAESERLRRAGGLCALLAGLDDRVLDGLATGSIQTMVNEARTAERRRRSAGGAR